MSIELPEFKTFSLCTRDGRKKYKATKLDVHPASRFVLRDDKRALSGFRFGLNDYIATPEGEAHTCAEVEAEVFRIVSDLQIEGIPIVRTSALPWTAPPRRERSGVRSRTPRGRAFMLRPSDMGLYYQPYSRYWEPVRLEAEASDVYVTLDAFRCGDFYAKYRDDAAICAALKLGTMPVVYGYKCGHAPAVGQKYETWRSAFVAGSLKLPHVQELLAQLAYVGNDSPSGDATAAIEERLGVDHPVARLCRRMHEASKMPFEVKHALRDLLMQTGAKHPTADNFALRRYPLLAAEGVAKLWSNHAAAWLDYVAGKKRAK